MNDDDETLPADTSELMTPQMGKGIQGAATTMETNLLRKNTTLIG